MKTYNVRVPITGVADIEVEAENVWDALNAALQNVTSEHITEWEAVRKIVSGNVFYGHTNEARVEEMPNASGLPRP